MSGVALNGAGFRGLVPVLWWPVDDASENKGERFASEGSSIASDAASIVDLSDAAFEPQPWLETVPQLLKELFVHARDTAELEPGRELPSESVANQIRGWLASLANECPELPEPELLSTPDGSIQLSWSNAGAHLVVTGKSAWEARARFEDMATGNVERATLDWGDSGPILPLVERLVRGFA